MLRELWEDAVQLARAEHGRPVAAREVVRTALMLDGFSVLALQRLRERGRWLPGLGRLVRRVQTVLYGIELGGKFPRDPMELKALLGAYDLELIGGWYSAGLLLRTAEEEIVALQPHLALLKAMGSGIFILAETSNAIHSDIARPLTETPRLPDEAWPEFGRRLSAVS